MALGVLSNFAFADNSKNNADELALASVEAISQSEGVSNTGPREEKKCNGGGHKMVCKCINSTPCTDSDCY